MASNPPPPPPLEPEVSNPVKRIRWATHRATGIQAENKRHSLKERLHRRMGSGTEKRDSLGKESRTSAEHSPESSETGADDQDPGRRVYFNVPLPQSERDEEGHPIAHYARNKIRTAKYTPLSFIPKNLWFQFHNIANIYFAFIIILGVCASPPKASLTCSRQALTRTTCRYFPSSVPPILPSMPSLLSSFSL